MTTPKLVTVRVLPHRQLSLPEGRVVFEGDAVDLPADEAKTLIDDGFVEKVK